MANQAPHNTNHYDWYASVNKYLRGKIIRTSLAFTKIWPIRDRFIKHKYYCITVHYRTVCASENRLTNCPNWTANSQTSETIFGLCPRAGAKLNPCHISKGNYTNLGDSAIAGKKLLRFYKDLRT